MRVFGWKTPMRNESERCDARFEASCSIDRLDTDPDRVGAHMMGPERW